MSSPVCVPPFLAPNLDVIMPEVGFTNDIPKLGLEPTLATFVLPEPDLPLLLATTTGFGGGATYRPSTIDSDEVNSFKSEDCTFK